jgi:hypothetical protein
MPNRAFIVCSCLRGSPLPAIQAGQSLSPCFLVPKSCGSEAHGVLVPPKRHEGAAVVLFCARFLALGSPLIFPSYLTVVCFVTLY